MSLFNRILSALLALVLLLGGLLGAIEVVLALLGRPAWLIPHPQWAAWLGEQTWDTVAVRAALGVTLVVGLLLLVPAFRRGRPANIALPTRTGGPSAITVVAARRGVERALAQAARRADGITAAQARVSRRTATVTARAATRTGDPKQAVHDAVTDRLTALGLDQSLRPRVRVTVQEARR